MKTTSGIARGLQLLVLCIGLWIAPSVHARRVRPFFEPTDLELEQPGVAEFDLQLGVVRSRGPARAVIPDFELDLGLLSNLEFDLDGAYAVEGPSRGRFSFDHAVPDSLWPAFKWGLYDANDPAAHTAFALGLQLGPKLPVAAAAHGLGLESLLLVGTALGPAHLVWNAGFFIDPDPDNDPGRPTGLELGVDAEFEATDAWSLQAGCSAVRFLSDDPDQGLVSAGIAYSPFDALELSLTALVGFFPGGDRYGLLLGISPKFRVFR